HAGPFYGGRRRAGSVSDRRLRVSILRSLTLPARPVVGGPGTGTYIAPTPPRRIERRSFTACHALLEHRLPLLPGLHRGCAAGVRAREPAEGAGVPAALPR